jgi:hypothetical protein
MFEFIQEHPFWFGVVGYWIFSAAVSAMREPMPGGSPGYAWAFRFLHTLAGNLSTAFAGRLPGTTSAYRRHRLFLALLVLIPLL